MRVLNSDWRGVICLGSFWLARLTGRMDTTRTIASLKCLFAEAGRIWLMTTFHVDQCLVNTAAKLLL